MSAGTVVWGICNSAFQRDTLRGKQWISENGPYLDTFQVWRNVDYYSWDNSWNVGFSNGHGAMYDISHDETYARHHRWLTHKLLSYDTDSDGGIMATTQDADTTDMTWVSAYLCMMGLDRLIGEVHDRDAGALELLGLYDGAQIEPGTTIDIRAVVSNYGREPLSGVQVKLAGSATCELDFLGMDTLTLASNWTVTDSAVLVLVVSHYRDINPGNDTLVVRLNKAAGVEGAVERSPAPLGAPQLEVTALANAVCRIGYRLGDAPHGGLALYSILGERIRCETLNAPAGTLEWNLDDLPAGVYFVRLDAGPGLLIRRLVRLR